MQFRFGDIYNDYDVLMNALIKAKAKAGDGFNWKPQDVIYSIMSGNSSFVVNNNDVAVFYRKTTEYSTDHTLWIWVAYSEHGDAVSNYFEDFKELATQGECKKIGFSSLRRGYEKFNEHFRIKEVIYEFNL